ncbi:MAG TPA: hypothetical protein VIF57_13675, partial [Polyangia bacterium]
MIERAIRGWNCRTSTAVMLGWLAVAVCGGAASGCAGEIEEPATSTVSLQLDFGGGITLTSVDYVMTGPNSFRRVGTLAVGADPIVTATFHDLPRGQGYNIMVMGTASDDMTGCRGQLTFNVTASGNANLQIPMMCQGRLLVTATFDNTCPVIDELSAIPAEVNVGASIQLTAQSHDADNAPSPVGPIWSTTGGALSNPSATGATFTCTAPGTFTVGLRVSDGKCQDAATVKLT